MSKEADNIPRDMSVFLHGGDNMKMVYIASPFRGDYETNLKNAVEYCKIASYKGVLPVAPHIMYSGWCRDYISKEREMGLKLGYELLSHSAELWVMGKVHSEGMKGEIQYAWEHQIPTFYIPEPLLLETYPVSIDEYSLLCELDCELQSMAENITGQVVILRHNCLDGAYRSSRNQMWIATHGPGCGPDSFTGTVHIRHPVDGDSLAVGRHELCGVVSGETLIRMVQQYPDIQNCVVYHSHTSKMEALMER